ncbi:MAG: hypothetical protein QNJ73_10045 [Gammaproteobacteria bacterium]|nr:hypothetical protein [Gammaproteobacteria bacterium]
MNRLLLIVGLSFTLYWQQAQSADGHCTETTKQTSVDFDGPVFRTTCQSFVDLDEQEFAKEKKNCEKGAKKNRAKAWLAGDCPIEGRISTCTIEKIGPMTLPQPRVIHTYEEEGGNLDLRSQIELARQQCSQMGLGSAGFTAVESES